MDKNDLKAIADLLDTKLEPIKNQLQELSPIKSQLQENTQILKALEHSSEIHKADIDNLTHQIAEIHGTHEAEIRTLRRKPV